MKRERNEYMREYYAKRKAEGKLPKLTAKQLAQKRKAYKANKLDYYLIYYLPNENYCGITTDIHNRMKAHKTKGFNIDKWKVLFCCKNRTEAHYQEAMFQSVLGMNGLNFQNK